MRLGYACINTTLKKEGKFKTITVKKALTIDKIDLINKIKGITIDNLYTTYKILQWNVQHNIFIYRMTSNMIPLATHELLKDWQWWNDKDIIRLCTKIRKYTQENNIDISFHPDQFCVINSPKEDVFNMAKDILEYHNRLSELLGCNILVLHVGGVYGDKNAAIQRFIYNFKRLPKDIQDKIVLENDDKSFTVPEVLYICEQFHIPMVLDLHHYRVNNNDEDIEDYIDRIKNTWDNKTSIPAIHLSSGRDDNLDRKHADYITQEDYKWALNVIKGNFNMMLECKKKEQAILKLREEN